MGSDESVIQQSENSSTPSVSGQILISVHGSAKSGKTTLINQFIGKSFDSNYFPTKQMESRQVLWKSIQQPEKMFRIVVWDVVESTTTSPKPVDTISRADGIVVIYDPNDLYSVEYALSILYKLPISESDQKSQIPVLILSNFFDTHQSDTKSHKNPKTKKHLHPRLRNAPYPQLQVNMKTGLGLDICAIWLDRAILYNKHRSLDAQLKSVREEKEELAISLRISSSNIENKQKNNQKMLSHKNSQSLSKKKVAQNVEHNSNRIRMPSLSELLTVKIEDNKNNNDVDNHDYMTKVNNNNINDNGANNDNNDTNNICDNNNDNNINENNINDNNINENNINDNNINDININDINNDEHHNINNGIINGNNAGSCNETNNENDSYKNESDNDVGQIN